MDDRLCAELRDQINSFAGAECQISMRCQTRHHLSSRCEFGCRLHKSNNDSKLDFALTSQGNSEVNVLLASRATSPPPTIFIEEGTTNKAAALDSVTRLRGPFSILNTHNFSADQRTRVLLFTSNLGLSQPDSSILSVRANGILLTIESVGTVSGVQGLNASYIIVKLPDGMSGNVALTVTLHGVVSSNAPTIEISP